MEWTTILGLILGFASMGGVLVLGKTEASLNTFIDPPALLMVFGGAAAVALVGFPVAAIAEPLFHPQEAVSQPPGGTGRADQRARAVGGIGPQRRTAGPGGQGPGNPRSVHRPGNPTGGRRHAAGGRRRDHEQRGREPGPRGTARRRRSSSWSAAAARPSA